MSAVQHLRDNKTQAGSGSAPEDRYYILKKRGSGCFSITHLAVSRQIADEVADEVKSESTKISKAAACGRLRANLVCIKVSTCASPSRHTDNLDEEIRILLRLDEHKHPNLVELLDSDSAVKGKKWYAMPCYSGGSLDDYKEVFDEWPAALSWHIAIQLCSAFLFLHFGIKEKDQEAAPDWPLHKHGDVHIGNFLLRYPRSGCNSYGDYPDVVLADFGKASEYIEHERSTPRDRDFFLLRQHRELANDLSCVLDMLIREMVPQDTSFSKAIDMLRRIAEAETGTKTNEGVRRVVMAFIEGAEKKRGKMYEPLPPNIRAYFEEAAVSDDELHRMIQDTPAYRNLAK